MIAAGEVAQLNSAGVQFLNSSKSDLKFVTVMLRVLIMTQEAPVRLQLGSGPPSFRVSDGLTRINTSKLSRD